MLTWLGYQEYKEALIVTRIFTIRFVLNIRKGN